jgi:dipeptidyl aminopeptidase/acylaminoacyl peptidase
MQKSVLTLLCLLAAGSAAMAGKHAYTIEDQYKLKGLEGLNVAPDGAIVFAVRSSDLHKAKQSTHLWMMNAQGVHARQITYSEKSESSPALSPDGRWIAFVSSREGSENLYLMPMAGGEARKLTDISTGAGDPVWSPDNKWIAFSSDVYPECGADDACNKKVAERWSKGKLQAHMADGLLYRHWTEWKDGKRTHIFVVEIASGKIRDMTPGNFDSPPFQLGGGAQYDFSPDSSELVYVSNHDASPASSTNNDLWTVPLAGNGDARNITADNKAFDGNPKYSPDGKFIAYRMQKQAGYESDLFRLAVYERATGKSRVLTESFRNWVDDFRWSPDSNAILFSAPVEGNFPIYQADLASGAVKQVLEDKSIGSFVLSRDGRKLVYTRSSAGEPPEIYAVNPGGSPQRLSHFNDAVAAEVDIRPAEKMWIPGAGGAKIQTFIVKPHDFDPNKKYPLILNVHGGPQSQWADSFRGDWQVYPGAGYVVAYANPHGSTGYGQDFTAQISGDWGGQVFEDLMKVTDALAKLPYVDADRMGAMGWSYGGYMMNWFEGHTTRFKAIVSMMGLYDLRSFYGATEELWFPEWDVKGQPWNSALYEKYSPSNYVKNFKTPCMVITGERDYRVPYTQSLQFFTALQKMKVPSRLLVYTKAGHWPDWYEMALYYTAHLEWFHKYLGGQAPPWTTEQFLRNAVFDPATGERYK